MAEHQPLAYGTDGVRAPKGHELRVDRRLLTGERAERHWACTCGAFRIHDFDKPAKGAYRIHLAEQGA